jgi:hypothetical protein
MPEIPYQDDQVVEILIDGTPEWLPIVKGSLKVVEIGFPLGSGDTAVRMGFTVVDAIDKKEVFFYVERLVAVKYTFEETVSTKTADGRLLP